LRELAAGRGKSQSDLDLQPQRAQLAKKQREKIELQIGQMKGKLLDAEEVKQTWIKLIYNCRARLLAIPTRLAVEIINCKTPAHAQAMLRDLIYEALTELSQGKNSGCE
jgi:phage terminase Nu1 subunit (DNA packaging protein)